MSIIEVKGLTKSYGRHRGITDVSFDVMDGEFFGFIGPNGAGKSTTIRTLLGLISADSGEAKIFGKDIVKQKTEILSELGYMPSEIMFYNGMRVKDIITLSAKMRRKDCSAEAKRLCERLALDTEKRVEELSLGNRKKAAVVCALQHKPRLCILDEPTSGLDPLMQREFFDILTERHKEGATIFFSSHILSEIQKFCSRAAIIKEGSIIALDSVANLSGTGVKRVVLHGVNTLPAGITSTSAEVLEDSVSFLYSGDIKALLKSAAEMPLNDITISEPDLEEVFMHYYEKGGENV